VCYGLGLSWPRTTICELATSWLLVDPSFYAVHPFSCFWEHAPSMVHSSGLSVEQQGCCSHVPLACAVDFILHSFV
jgi:hypothetical protein